MKTISMLLASILCAGAPVVPAEAKPKTEQRVVNSFLLGDDVVKSVREGDYSDFLKEMDSDYRKAMKANQLTGLIEIRKDTGKIKIDPEFAKSYGVIQKNKNKQLLSIVSGDSIFDKKIQSAARSLDEVDPRFLELNYKEPGSGKNADENVLIDISLEYYYKSTHLDSISSNQKEKHMALEMEKMKKMQAAAESFQDKELKAMVNDAANSLDARLAKSYDTNDLLSLGKGKMKPATPQEESAAAIVSASQGELAELHRQLLKSL